MRVLYGSVGIPMIRYFGTEGDFSIMALDLLGPSLEDLFNACSRRFTLKTTLMLADQLLRRMESIHSKKYLHRDIKPDNFLMGLGDEVNVVNVIDFGLAKKFWDIENNKHIPYRENKQLTGTARYASINTHLGIEQSRRDDLESLGYVLLYFLRGSLPWQGLRAQNKSHKYRRILQRKIRTSVDELTQDHPEEFLIYMQYCRSLPFGNTPDYAYLRSLFRNVFLRMGYTYDFDWDWISVQYNFEDRRTNYPHTPRRVANRSPREKNSSSFRRNTRPSSSGDIIRSTRATGGSRH
eukprot:TRINITY_DN6252_c0_g1_i2.p1 TRINITY_DN6252_c0_g1~~TRINITY_DN6252_c0_g1_i2.p1  ORF type:complete len:294 (+),score=40.31 TRINITY_DN6252_c0_g1_i2:246-1127(+)